mmetsp:Transcript_21039/g.42334  ORF Transcript_21039/g.42334 Transcript_21039/m.42334 type:complete len:209 (+) Transcript_21039:3103-3729(+)
MDAGRAGSSEAEGRGHGCDGDFFGHEEHHGAHVLGATRGETQALPEIRQRVRPGETDGGDTRNAHADRQTRGRVGRSSVHFPRTLRRQRRHTHPTRTVYLAKCVAAAADHDAGVHHHRLHTLCTLSRRGSFEPASDDGVVMAHHDRIALLLLLQACRPAAQSEAFEQSLPPSGVHLDAWPSLHTPLLHELCCEIGHRDDGRGETAGGG